MKKKYKVLITGGSRGIGRSIVKIFNKNDYHVIAPLRNDMDLSSSKSILNFFSNPVNKQFDILINNAGINIPKKFQQIDFNILKKTIQTNLEAPYMLTQNVIEHMIKNKWGRIINISSAYSFLSKEGRSVYSSTKAGMDALTRSLAVEFSKYNILTNSIAPGFVNTELTKQNNTKAEIKQLCKKIPINRLATPNEVAKIVFFLASKENTYISGQTIVVDGGFSKV